MAPFLMSDSNPSPTKSITHSVFLDAINLRSSPKKSSLAEPSWASGSYFSDSDLEEEDISINPFAVIRTRPPSPVETTTPHYPSIFDEAALDPISFYEFGLSSYRFPPPEPTTFSSGPASPQELMIPTMNSAETWQSPIVFAPEEEEEDRRNWSILPPAGFVYPKESAAETSTPSFVTASAFADRNETPSTSHAISESEPSRYSQDSGQQVEVVESIRGELSFPTGNASDEPETPEVPELTQTPRRAKRIWNRLRSGSWRTP